MVNMKLIILLLCWTTWLNAENPCDVLVSPLKGSQEDSFDLQIATHGRGGSRAPEISTNNDFVVASTGSQTRTQIINGSISTEVIYTYS